MTMIDKTTSEELEKLGVFVFERFEEALRVVLYELGEADDALTRGGLNIHPRPFGGSVGVVCEWASDPLDIPVGDLTALAAAEAAGLLTEIHVEHRWQSCRRVAPDEARQLVRAAGLATLVGADLDLREELRMPRTLLRND